MTGEVFFWIPRDAIFEGVYWIEARFSLRKRMSLTSMSELKRYPNSSSTWSPSKYFVWLWISFCANLPQRELRQSFAIERRASFRSILSGSSRTPSRRSNSAMKASFSSSEDTPGGQPEFSV